MNDRIEKLERIEETCWCCGNQLLARRLPADTAFWQVVCLNWECRSSAAIAGAVGETQAEAALKLTAAIEEETER